MAGLLGHSLTGLIVRWGLSERGATDNGVLQDDKNP